MNPFERPATAYHVPPREAWALSQAWASHTNGWNAGQHMDTRNRPADPRLQAHSYGLQVALYSKACRAASVQQKH